jgi:hypothetical protein
MTHTDIWVRNHVLTHFPMDKLPPYINKDLFYESQTTKLKTLVLENAIEEGAISFGLWLSPVFSDVAECRYRDDDYVAVPMNVLKEFYTKEETDEIAEFREDEGLTVDGLPS